MFVRTSKLTYCGMDNNGVRSVGTLRNTAINYRLNRHRSVLWVPSVSVPLLFALGGFGFSVASGSISLFVIVVGVFTTKDLYWYPQAGLVSRISFMGYGVLVLNRIASSAVDNLTLTKRETFDGDRWQDLHWVCVQLSDGREVVLRQIEDEAMALEYASLTCEATGLGLKRR